MRFLFVHQNWPAQYVHLLRHLTATPGHEVVFITEPNGNVMPGVRCVPYQMRLPPDAGASGDARDLVVAATRAAAVATLARQLKGLGFVPDIVIGHHGWGELLNIGDVWPGVPVLGYFEYFHRTAGQDVDFDPEFPVPAVLFPGIRARNAVNLLALTNPGLGQTPTQFQKSTYPDWAQDRIVLLREGVRLDRCTPRRDRGPLVIGGVPIAADDKLVTFVARDLEPYRGFHVLMRALPAVLRARRDVRVMLVGGDGVSYGARLAAGSWRRHMLDELGAAIDPNRVHFPGKLDYGDYVRLLQRSDAHVYLTYPFVASWSLREALACGCALVCSDTAPVREFVAHGETGLLTPFLDPGSLSDRIREVLEGGSAVEGRRTAARRWAEANLDLSRTIGHYDRLIVRLAGRSIRSPQDVADGPVSGPL